MSVRFSRYDRERKTEHNTVGDARERYDRDADAFAAGAQWAMDNLLSDLLSDGVSGVLGPSISEYVDAECARLLARAHRGIL